MSTKLPHEDTFNLAICEEISTLVKNRKVNDQSEKRKFKRKLEKEVLRLFTKQGEEKEKKKLVSMYHNVRLPRVPNCYREVREVLDCM